MSKRSFVHIEIPARDRQAAAKFYEDAFGWPAQHSGDPMPYTTMETGNVGVGLPDLGENYKPGDVVVYLGSDDVEADLKKIEAAGGKRLCDPFPVGDFGVMAYFADTTGNRLALWKELKANM